MPGDPSPVRQDASEWQYDPEMLGWNREDGPFILSVTEVTWGQNSWRTSLVWSSNTRDGELDILFSLVTSASVKSPDVAKKLADAYLQTTKAILRQYYLVGVGESSLMQQSNP